MALICPIGREVLHAGRQVPRHQMLVTEPSLAATPDSDFDEIAVVQTQPKPDSDAESAEAKAGE